MATSTNEHVETAPPGRKKRKARWNIETTLRDVVLTQMVMVVANKESSHAAVCKASALLLRAEAQNQKDEQRKKKKVVKTNIPVVHLDWNCEGARVGGQPSASSGQEESGTRSQKSEVGDQIAREDNSKGQDPVSVTPPRRKRARRWNIKPEYRDVMVRRWSMIVADPKASQTAKFAVAALMMRAEAQNQKDEEHRRKTKKNRPPKQIVVGWTRDFYNNNAHELAAARAAAEASAGSSVADTEENRDLRPEVQQDAVRAGGLGPQSWYATGPPPARG